MLHFLVLMLFIVTANSFGQEFLEEFNKIYYSVQDANGKNFSSPDSYIQALSNQMNTDIAKMKPEQQLVYKGRAAEVFANITANSNNIMTSEAVNQLKKVEREMLEFEKSNTVGKEFQTMLAILSSRTIHFESLANTLKISKRNRDNYQKALKADRNYFPALIAQGQYFFYAPAVGGGDLNKALKNFETVCKNTTNSMLKYEAHIWKSQVFFRNNRKNEAKQELEKAAAIFPEGRFHNIVQNANNRGNFFQIK